jgi:hypothetical protein
MPTEIKDKDVYLFIIFEKDAYKLAEGTLIILRHQSILKLFVPFMAYTDPVLNLCLRILNY